MTTTHQHTMLPALVALHSQDAPPSYTFQTRRQGPGKGDDLPCHPTALRHLGCLHLGLRSPRADNKPWSLLWRLRVPTAQLGCHFFFCTCSGWLVSGQWHIPWACALPGVASQLPLQGGLTVLPSLKLTHFPKIQLHIPPPTYPALAPSFLWDEVHPLWADIQGS